METTSAVLRGTIGERFDAPPPRNFTSDELLDIRDIANRLAVYLALPSLYDRGLVLLIATAVADGAFDRPTLQRLLHVLEREASGKSHSLSVGRLTRAASIEAATCGQSLGMIFDRDFPRELLATRQPKVGQVFPGTP